MKDKLISELMEWVEERIKTWGKMCTGVEEYSEGRLAAFLEVKEWLSRHEAEQGEGLRGGMDFPDSVFKWAREWGIKPSALDALAEAFSPAKPTEPVKDCGFTLATCPYERCSGITMRKPEEPLAVLADRKGLVLDWAGKRAEGMWEIWFNNFPESDFIGSTYAQAEQAARAYLMALPTKAEKGGE